MLDNNSRLPLYIQLKLWIIEQIESGHFKNGSKIPTEHNLSQMHKISRPTVRQALSELVQEGHLVKKRGLGTYVSIPLITGEAKVFRTFAEEMDLFGFEHDAKVITATSYQSSRELADLLAINPGEEVYEVTRLRLANNKPMAIRTSIIPVSIYPNLLEKELKNLYSLFKEKGIYPARSKQYFQAVPATAEEASLLHVLPGAPLMLWDGIVYSENDLPIEKVKICYLGSQFRFEIEQSRDMLDNITSEIKEVNQNNAEK